MNAPRTHAPSQAAYATRLRKRQRELREEIHTQFADHDDPRVMALRNRLQDTEDWALAEEMAALDIAQVARDARELAEVEAALARVADGSYGTCADCGVEVPAARLTANPAARRCVACQTRLERAGAPPPTL
jgi:DnaK suppressor protein